jgi:hypothetical protein
MKEQRQLLCFPSRRKPEENGYIDEHLDDLWQAYFSFFSELKKAAKYQQKRD